MEEAAACAGVSDVSPPNAVLPLPCQSMLAVSNMELQLLLCSLQVDGV